MSDGADEPADGGRRGGSAGLVRGFFASLDRQHGAAVPAITTPSFVAHLAGGRALGAADFAAALDGLYAAFPDLQHQILDLLVDDDRAAARLCERGTHAGTFQAIAASGRVVAMNAIAILRFEQGRVAELWMEVDAPARLAQISGEG